MNSRMFTCLEIWRKWRQLRKGLLGRIAAPTKAPKLSSMFETLDVNQDGTVSLEEFMQMSVGSNDDKHASLSWARRSNSSECGEV